MEDYVGSSYDGPPQSLGPLGRAIGEIVVVFKLSSAVDTVLRGPPPSPPPLDIQDGP